MHEQYYKWKSPHLGREFEMLVFGEEGYPLILFPTSMGRHYEHKERGLIHALQWFIDHQLIRVYCPDSIDARSWYNKQVSPAQRTLNHIAYDNMLRHEVLERVIYETGVHRVALAGCSFGGYHASNFAFRYPEQVSYLFSLSGIFDITSRLDGHYDDNVYFNNPMDYMRDNPREALWRMGIILGVADEDIARNQNERMSGILAHKGISHWLDVRPNQKHDWPVWNEMLPYYLSLIK
ncbi:MULTISPECIES: alpha/beta hydrolase-fold protein [unclassified Chitinophaga]|uniref:alpha/beta hydrolase-fold protein n=1 Tax=unclassified Chitinophaga TaxID=2619133 RepID=UPI0009CCA7E7|nr:MULTISPECIES: alpha/beta hydrolase-fold protein [unclassified Chitinophaga]OMP79317.1 esterase [[Flexibacter] sp. ATCC 35208]WPV63718.1 alpha/beta hydrolase-fold protein [Chitinophaga sp. LS1]